MIDASTYWPSDAVLERVRLVHLVAVVGPSGVGKTTLMHAARSADPSIQFVITDTSRAPRPVERDGVDYNFCSKDDMLERVARREYVNVAPSLTGDLYTTDPTSFPDSGVGMMAIWADAISYFRRLPFASFKTIYIAPADFEAWQARIAQHNFEPEVLQKRLTEAARSLQFALDDPATHIVVNGDLETAQHDFLHAVQAPIDATFYEQPLECETVRKVLATLQSKIA